MLARSSGHTLPELLIAMAVSMLLISALIGTNNLGLKAVRNLDNSQAAIGKIQQSLRLLEADLKHVYSSGCLVNKTWISDLVLTQPADTNNRFTSSWLSGFDNNGGGWFPQPPYFDNTDIAVDSPAINLLYADVAESLTAASLNADPQRLVFLTNCAVAEISRADDSMLATSIGPLRIHPFQSVLYYLKQTETGLTLYRQYLTESGNTRNEPLADGIDKLVIAFGEAIDASTLAFRQAQNVEDWGNIAAIYVAIHFSISTVQYSSAVLVELDG